MANGINDAGQIIGWSHTSGGESHAVLWENGESAPKDLGTLGGSKSFAYAINETGQIVGGSDITDDSVYHAVRWQNEGMLDLGTLGGSESEAFGINDAGQIVVTDSRRHSQAVADNRKQSQAVPGRQTTTSINHPAIISQQPAPSSQHPAAMAPWLCPGLWLLGSFPGLLLVLVSFLALPFPRLQRPASSLKP